MFKEPSNTQSLINQINFRAVIMQIRKSDIDKAQHKIYNPPSIKKKKFGQFCVLLRNNMPFALFGDDQTLGSLTYWVEFDTHISEKVQ